MKEFSVTTYNYQPGYGIAITNCEEFDDKSAAENYYNNHNSPGRIFLKGDHGYKILAVKTVDRNGNICDKVY